MASRIRSGAPDLRLDRRQPATSSRSVPGKRAAGRSTIPSPVSSTVNSVPGPQARESRIPLGRMIWPLVESRVVSIGKTSVRLSHIPACDGWRLPATQRPWQRGLAERAGHHKQPLKHRRVDGKFEDFGDHLGPAVEEIQPAVLDAHLPRLALRQNLVSEQSRNVLFFGKVEMSYFEDPPPVRVLPFPLLRILVPSRPGAVKAACLCAEGKP
jgi:hypothetical protein